MKTAFSLLALITAVADPSSRPARPDPDATAGAFFAVSVPDLKASAAWYTNNLDLRVVRELPPTNDVAVIILEGNGLLVELLQPLHAPAPPPAEHAPSYGFTKAGFFVRDFADVVARLRARGTEIAFGPFPAQSDQSANVIIRDNAGNLIQIFGQ